MRNTHNTIHHPMTERFPEPSPEPKTQAQTMSARERESIYRLFCLMAGTAYRPPRNLWIGERGTARRVSTVAPVHGPALRADHVLRRRGWKVGASTFAYGESQVSTLTPDSIPWDIPSGSTSRDLIELANDLLRRDAESADSVCRDVDHGSEHGCPSCTSVVRVIGQEGKEQYKRRAFSQVLYFGDGLADMVNADTSTHAFVGDLIAPDVAERSDLFGAIAERSMSFVRSDAPEGTERWTGRARKVSRQIDRVSALQTHGGARKVRVSARANEPTARRGIIHVASDGASSVAELPTWVLEHDGSTSIIIGHRPKTGRGQTVQAQRRAAQRTQRIQVASVREYGANLAQVIEQGERVSLWSADGQTLTLARSKSGVRFTLADSNGRKIRTGQNMQPARVAELLAL